MPLWPFVMLLVIFLAVLFLPPLIAAYVDYTRERAQAQPRSGGGTAPERPGERVERSG